MTNGYDTWRTTDTVGERRAEQDLAHEHAVADYVQDWIDGTLYDDGETYTAPVMELVTDDVISDLLTAKTDEALAAAARRLARMLRENIEKQAGEC